MLDCIIYCTGQISLQELRIRLAALSGTKNIEVSFIENGFYELSVYNNDAFNLITQKDFPDGFMNFKFIVEVGFNSDSKIDQAVAVVSKLLKWLWEIKMPAVASCDYEDLLPENGGYNSTAIPWLN